MPQLISLTPVFDSHKLPDRGSVTIGRAASGDIVVNHPAVSRAHADIVVNERVVTMLVKSLNGALVRNRSGEAWKMVNQHSAVTLASGSEILLVNPAWKGDPDMFTIGAVGRADPTDLGLPHFVLHMDSVGPTSLITQAAEDDVLRHYEFLREVGRGTFGVCWQARERFGQQRTVAIKVISKAGAEMHGTAVASIAQEARMLAHLHHPHILELLQAVETPSFVVIITEFCAEGSLEGVISRARRQGHRLTERACIALFRPIIEGLAFLHARKVIHRDIKPANILLQNDTSSSAAAAASAAASTNSPYPAQPPVIAADPSTPMPAAAAAAAGEASTVSVPRIRIADFGECVWHRAMLLPR